MATTTAQVEAGPTQTRVVGGHAPDYDDIQKRSTKVKGRHVVVFWIGTAAGLGAAAYIYHASKYKFETRRIQNYMKHGSELAYALGYLVNKTVGATRGNVEGTGPQGPAPSTFAGSADFDNP